MIIARYLSREIIHTLLVITLILLLAILSQQVVRYLNYIAIGKIPTNVLLQLVSFEAPYILSLLLPLGLYLSVLLTYGRLYADNEMAILQMVGFSQRRLMRLTIFIALFVASIVLVLMMWVNPFVSVKRQNLMASDEATLHLVQTLMPGRFQVSPDGKHVMYVEKLSRDHLRAGNVFLAQQKKTKVTDEMGQNAWTLVLAGEGYQTKETKTEDQFFVTEDGFRYEGIPGHNDYKIIQFKKYSVRIPENHSRITHEENKNLSSLQLWQGYSSPKRAAELQWRFSLVIATLLMAMLAVPLSTVKPRKSRYVMLVPAILIYIVYIQLLNLARHWLEQRVVPISIGVWWVHGVIFLFVMSVILFSSKEW